MIYLKYRCFIIITIICRWTYKFLTLLFSICMPFLDITSSSKSFCNMSYRSLWIPCWDRLKSQDEPAARILELCILHLAMAEITSIGTRHQIVINEASFPIPQNLYLCLYSLHHLHNRFWSLVVKAVDLAKRFCDGCAPRVINGCLRTFVKEYNTVDTVRPSEAPTAWKACIGSQLSFSLQSGVINLRWWLNLWPQPKVFASSSGCRKKDRDWRWISQGTLLVFGSCDAFKDKAIMDTVKFQQLLVNFPFNGDDPKLVPWRWR